MLDTPNFTAAINQICDEKKISKEKVLDAIKDALAAAYRRDYGNRDQHIDILLDADTGRATVLLVKTVVSEVTNPRAEISIGDAQQIKQGLKEGTKIKIDVTPIEFGRIASQTAKQALIAALRDAESEAIFGEYADRQDELLNALVHHLEGRFVHLELDRTTAVLEPRDQIPRERYLAGQRVKVYLEKVEMTPRGPRLRLSRTHPRFIQRLLELEIPEVRNGTVVVKAIAREAGTRCKLIVASTDSSVDPVGACVGQKGSRIQNITDEVGGERIDVIEWTENFEELLRETLSPAKIDSLSLYPEEKRVEVFVAEDQRALAIGKGGQNVRLAGQILGWEIDVLNTAELMDGKVAEALPEEVPAEEAAPEAALDDASADADTAANDNEAPAEEEKKEAA